MSMPWISLYLKASLSSRDKISSRAAHALGNVDPEAEVVVVVGARRRAVRSRGSGEADLGRAVGRGGLGGRGAAGAERSREDECGGAGYDGLPLHGCSLRRGVARRA